MILKRRYVICFTPTKKHEGGSKLYFVDKGPVRYTPYLGGAHHFKVRGKAKQVLRSILICRRGYNPYWRHSLLSLVYRDEEDGRGAVLLDIKDEPERPEPTGRERTHPAHQDVPSRSHCNTGRP